MAKIRMNENYKRLYTIENVEQMRECAKCIKEDYDKSLLDDSANALAKRAEIYCGDSVYDVIFSEFELCIDSSTAIDFYGDTGRADVLVTVIARTRYGMLKATALLSKVMTMCDDPDGMIIEHYTKD